MLLWGLVILTFSLLLACAGLYDGGRETAQAMSQRMSGRLNQAESLNNMFDIGYNGFWFFAGPASGMVGVLIGLTLTMSSIISLLRGSPTAGKNPHTTVRQFYKNLLNDPVFGKDEYTGTLAAFACLSGKARQDIGGFQDFGYRWRGVKGKIIGTSINRLPSAARKLLPGNAAWKVEAVIRKPSVRIIDQATAHYEAKITCSIFHTQNRIGKHSYTATGEMCLVGDRWYLNDGNWSGVADVPV